jgi:hypothetical protein
MRNFDKTQILEHFRNDLEWMESSIVNFLSEFTNTSMEILNEIQYNSNCDLAEIDEIINIAENFYSPAITLTVMDLQSAARNGDLEDAARLLKRLDDERTLFEYDFNSFLELLYADRKMEQMPMAG